MREHRFFIGILLLLLLFAVGSVMAQDEATEEPEATEVMDQPEMTEEPEMTAEPEETEEPEEAPPVTGDVYIVQRGDNLFRIALRFGLTTGDLVAANNITNPSLIFVGQRLTIPGLQAPEPQPTEEPEPEESPEPQETQEPVTPPPASSTYIVQRGDSLFRIAVHNNTTLARLLALNSNILNPNLIFVGQRINLPGAGSNGDHNLGVGVEVMTSRGVEVLLGESVTLNATQLLEIGVEWVKITVDWADVEPGEGSFDFSALDEAISEFEGANEDILVMLTLTGAPDWSRPSATELALEQPTYGPPDDLDTFGTFVAEVAGHYAGRVDAYEIWSQPNNRLSWMTTDVELRSDGFPDARLSPVRYIDLLEVAVSAIRDVDEDTLILSAGLAPTGINDYYNSIDNFVFFEALLQQGALDLVDGMGVHIDGFSNAPDTRCCGQAGEDPAYDESDHFFFADTLDNYREILNRNGGTFSPLYVTRFGWGTTEGASGDGTGVEFVSLNSADDQAQYIADALEAGEARADVAVMILYNLNGCGVADTRACYYSLVDSSGVMRPAADSVSLTDE